MTRKLHIILGVLILLVISGSAFAQLGGPRELRRINAQPDEMISMTRSMPFNQAIMIFSDLSKRKLNRILIDPENRVIPIGVNIENMHWLDALEMILDQNGLWYKDYPDHIQIVSKDVGAKVGVEVDDAREMYETREVIISAVFFEADQTKLRSMGSQWSFLNPDSSIGVDMSAAQDKTGSITITALDAGDYGSISATFRALESKSVGEVIASPRVTVQSGTEGRVQIGTDFSITTTDFAGNTITQFYSAGSIINVTPRVFAVDTTYFISLSLDVQKSAAASSDLGVEITKTSAVTSVLLLDGEETLIGGLYSNEESVERSGVPVLKDLPWWVFGLRYIFGYEARNVSRKELMILIKAELVPSLENRVRMRIARDNQPLPVLKESRDEFERDIIDYRRQSDLFDRSQIKEEEDQKAKEATEQE